MPVRAQPLVDEVILTEDYQTFSRLLLEVDDSQGAHVAAAYSSMLCTITMLTWRQSNVCLPQSGGG